MCNATQVREAFCSGAIASPQRSAAQYTRPTYALAMHCGVKGGSGVNDGRAASATSASAFVSAGRP